MICFIIIYIIFDYSSLEVSSIKSNNYINALIYVQVVHLVNSMIETNIVKFFYIDLISITFKSN